ncbi:hypothetical protein EON65_25750 [archaeon]|nr:MAG: hypothetical protein EON65_25750 [archaeon]
MLQLLFAEEAGALILPLSCYFVVEDRFSIPFDLCCDSFEDSSSSGGCLHSDSNSDDAIVVEQGEEIIDGAAGRDIHDDLLEAFLEDAADRGSSSHTVRDKSNLKIDLSFFLLNMVQI